MKPLNRKNYGSIPHLLGSKLGATDKYVHEGQHRIMTEKTRDKHDYVIVTEKYDGANITLSFMASIFLSYSSIVRFMSAIWFPQEVNLDSNWMIYFFIASLITLYLQLS